MRAQASCHAGPRRRTLDPARAKLNGYLEMPGGDGATVEVELDSRIYLNEDGVERTVVLLYERAGDVKAAIPSANDLAGHLKLTQAELRVLRLLPTHHSIERISQMLMISQNTVKTHLASVYRKSGVHSRSSAVARACALGILRPTQDGRPSLRIGIAPRTHIGNRDSLNPRSQ